MRLLLALLLWLFGAVGALAQVPATLAADRIAATADGRLVAEGNVEVFHDGTRMTAGRIVYDRVTDRLTVEGPILVVTANGTIFEAGAAALDPRLETGLLIGARLVLDRQLQLAAGRIDRVEGRFSRLTGVAATSCRVCSGRAPLWEIRARTVTHDQEARLLHFEGAQVRIGGVPVLWLPRLRLPDPTLDRASGFLIPTIRSSDRLGTGVRLPYFIRLGNARDLTLTPYLSSETRTLDLRYRQAFRSGALQFAGALTRDDLQPDDLRGYATLTGAFALPRDLRLSFDLEAVTDRAYLLDYGLTDTDFLESRIALFRVRDADYLRGALTVFESLRDGDDDDLLPSVVTELHYERRLGAEPLGGTLTLATGFDAFYRAETADGIGRDMARAGLSLGWHRTWIGPGGIVVEGDAALGLDVFAPREDSAFDSPTLRSVGAAGTVLRWPLIGTGAQGAVHVVEPVVQIAWSDVQGSPVPNEDSTVADFDEGNLLSLGRFAGEDAVETGLRGAVGLTWTRQGPRGWQSTLGFGRVFRRDEAPGFSASSGLSGTRSDWLIAGQIGFGGGLALGMRTLMDDAGSFNRSEARLDWATDRSALAAAYVFLPADAAEGRVDEVSEWTVDGRYRINRAWEISGGARYDLAADSPASARLGIDWRNECVAVGLSVSRRFTSSANVSPSTNLGLSVELLGFSAGGAGVGPARPCGATAAR